jgi:hypothetical protein
MSSTKNKSSSSSSSSKSSSKSKSSEEKKVKVPSKITVQSQTIAGIVSEFFKKFLAEKAGKGKSSDVSIDKLVKSFDSAKTQKQLVGEVKSVLSAKKLKDPNAPRKPKSTYFQFTDDKRAEVKEQNPGKSATQISSIIAELWANLSDKKKDKYKAKYEEKKAKYEEEMKHYNKPSDAELKALPENQPKVKVPKAKKPADYPKGAKNAYMFFAEDMRVLLEKEDPDMKYTEVKEIISELWKGEFLDAENRQVWTELAKEDKERFEEAVEEYKNKPKAEDAKPKKSKKAEEPEAKSKKAKEPEVKAKESKKAKESPKVYVTCKCGDKYIDNPENKSAHMKTEIHRYFSKHPEEIPKEVKSEEKPKKKTHVEFSD